MCDHKLVMRQLNEKTSNFTVNVTFKEDASRVRRDNCAENLGVIRHVAINILRQDKTTKGSVKGGRYKCALDSDYANKVLDGLF